MGNAYQGQGLSLHEFMQRFLLILFELEVPRIQPPICEDPVVVVRAIVSVSFLGGLQPTCGRIRNRFHRLKLRAIGK